MQLDEIIQGVILPPAEETLLLLSHTHRHIYYFFTAVFYIFTLTVASQKLRTHALWSHWDPLKVHAHAWDDDGHLTWAFKSQNIGFLPYGAAESVTALM